MLALEGFDEDFFLYGEDLDLCLRVRRAGWKIGYIPDAVVVHWGGQSERNNIPVRVWEKKTRAEITFFKKHYSQQTFRTIRRHNLLQAFWRIVSLQLTFPFTKDKESVTYKLEKYGVIARAYREGRTDDRQP